MTPRRRQSAHRLQSWARAENALAAAKTALADAERLHAGQVTDLGLALVSAEQIAAPHIAALAKARDAVAEAEAAHEARLVILHESVAKAQAESDTAYAHLKA